MRRNVTGDGVAEAPRLANALQLTRSHPGFSGKQVFRIAPNILAIAVALSLSAMIRPPLDAFRTSSSIGWLAFFGNNRLHLAMTCCFLLCC